MNPDAVVPIAFFSTVFGLAIGIPLVRAYIRRMDRGATLPGVPADLSARLDRIEAMVESVAVEVERLSEGQRFTTRLLSEGAVRPAVQPAVQRAPHQDARPNPTEVTHA